MRWLVRGIEACLVLVFFMDLLIPLSGFADLAFRGSYNGDFAPSVFARIQTQLSAAGAVEHFFSAFRYLALALLLEILWIFYRRALEIVASYQPPPHD